MNGMDLVVEAMVSLAANRMRSALATLGVIIGVASVMLMLAIGESSRRRVTSSIQSLGANQLVVVPGTPSLGGLRGSAGGLPTLKVADAMAIGELYSVAAVAPIATSSAQIVHGAANKSTQVTGSTPSYFEVANRALAVGESFSEVQARSAATVVVLGETVRQELFGADQLADKAIGQTVRIQRQTFTVIGVLRAKGQGFGGQDQDDTVVMPIDTAQRRLAGTAFPGSVDMVLVQSKFPEQKGYTQEEIGALLRQRHRIGAGSSDDFTVRDLSALSETLAATSQALSWLLGSIAFISLVVGGIGIMNIMLVSVTERTREIGLRMAVGARRRAIRLQFLVESALLSVGGAAGGAALAAGGAAGLQRVGMTPVFTPMAVIVALAMAVTVGIVFGWWPARQASRLAPAEALRVP